MRGQCQGFSWHRSDHLQLNDNIFPPSRFPNMPLKGKWNVLQFLLPSVTLRNFGKVLSPGPNTQETVTGFRSDFLRSSKYEKNDVIFFSNDCLLLQSENK